MITFKITQKFKSINGLVLEIIGIQSIGKTEPIYKCKLITNNMVHGFGEYKGSYLQTLEYLN